MTKRKKPRKKKIVIRDFDIALDDYRSLNLKGTGIFHSKIFDSLVIHKNEAEQLKKVEGKTGRLTFEWTE